MELSAGDDDADLLPVTIVFLLLQRYITQGIAAAGVK
jgi:ABC-type maltose transport system permease subunit